MREEIAQRARITAHTRTGMLKHTARAAARQQLFPTVKAISQSAAARVTLAVYDAVVLGTCSCRAAREPYSRTGARAANAKHRAEYREREQQRQQQQQQIHAKKHTLSIHIHVPIHVYMYCTVHQLNHSPHQPLRLWLCFRLSMFIYCALPTFIP